MQQNKKNKKQSEGQKKAVKKKEIMKKKNITILLPSLAFIAAIFLAAFVLLEFRSDYYAVGGAAIILLITAYFLMDRIESKLFEQQQIEKQYIEEGVERISKEVSEKCERLEIVEKAIYAVSKINVESTKNKLEEINQNIKEQ